MTYIYVSRSRNQPKSLSGIETIVPQSKSAYSVSAGINLNPYQGLKRGEVTPSCKASCAGINLNPYQGLKPYHPNTWHMGE